MNIYSQSLEDLENYFLSIEQKKFKAIQLFDWLYKKEVDSFDSMTNIKKSIIEQLKKDFDFKLPKIIKVQKSKEVCKYLFEFEDKQRVEAVLMFHDYGNSLCISTQVGCNMGCAFCESGRRKKFRNLTAGEMVGQILLIQNNLNLRITHVVLMGIGEPFDNYDNVMKFISIINSDRGIALGARHITVSTCGIIPKIKEFGLQKLQVNLAISLHAPTNEIRNKIMKINKAYPIEDLIEAIKEYIKKTNRRVTFEYILLKDINDTKECAYELAKLLKGINCYVNLIPYNETSHLQFSRPGKEAIDNFYDILKKQKICVTIRREFGSEISSACGQLRTSYEEEL